MSLDRGGKGPVSVRGNLSTEQHIQRPWQVSWVVCGLVVLQFAPPVLDPGTEFGLWQHKSLLSPFSTHCAMGFFHLVLSSCHLHQSFEQLCLPSLGHFSQFVSLMKKSFHIRHPAFKCWIKLFPSDLFLSQPDVSCKEQMTFSGAKSPVATFFLFFCGVSQLIISHIEPWYIHRQADIW